MSAPRWNDPLDIALREPVCVEGLVGLAVQIARTHDVEAIEREIAAQGGYSAGFTAMACHLLAGRQTFVLGPAMQALLEATSPRGLDLAQVKLPYSAFWVALPDFPLTMWNDKSGDHPVEGFYVVSGHYGDVPVLRCVVHGPAHEGCDWTDDAWHDFGLPLQGTLGEHVESLVTRVRDAGLRNEKLVEVVASLAVGLCLWLTTPSATCREETRDPVPRPDRRRDGFVRPAHARPYTVRYVAPDVEKRTTPQAVAELRTPTRQHWVRGHWHHYWTGSGDDRELSLRWLVPYRRGTDEAGVIERQVAVLKGG